MAKSGPRMPIEIIVVLVVLVLAVGGFLLLRRKPEALPSADKEALPPAPVEAPTHAPEALVGNDPATARLPPPFSDEALDDDEPRDETTAEPELPTRPADVTPTRSEPSAPEPFRFRPPPLGGTPSVPLPVEKPRPVVRDDAEARRAKERERYREGLAKTRGGFVAKLGRLFKGRPKVDADLRDQVEQVLFTADIGSATAQKLLDRVTEVLDRKEVADADAVWSVIREASLEILEVPGEPLDPTPTVKPYVLLAIGVNGVGKTTTLGKLAALHHAAGRKVLLVAGDTFRAAAVEQLDVWARRVGCALHKGADKADPSSVIFEGISRGRKEGFDVVLCDTAGRLHTRKELMDELAKVRRSAVKAIAQAHPESDREKVSGPHDTFLVLDATIGQNALAQAALFKEAMDFTGLVVTKLDGTAKGGVVLGICDEMKVPIRYVGIGEGIDDLREFNPQDFADALFVDRDLAASEAAATG